MGLRVANELPVVTKISKQTTDKAVEKAMAATTKLYSAFLLFLLKKLLHTQAFNNNIHFTVITAYFVNSTMYSET